MTFSHHAYYIEDSIANAEAYARLLRESQKIEPHDPSCIVRHFEKFGIDEARSLIELSSLRTTNARTFYFLSTASLTSEAQQALLKLFEEPQVGTVFILLVPHGTLLPTLQSRMMEWPEARPREIGAETSVTGQAKEFLGWPYKKRSDWITALLKEEDDARERVRTFLNELEAELYKKAPESREARESLAQIAHVRQYLSDKAPSLKMILEHFAATLPQ